MNIQNHIKLCTKVDKNQGLRNVKWSAVTKDNQHLLQHHMKPLPPHLETEKSLHNKYTKKKSKGKKQSIKNEKKHETSQDFEITQKIRESGLGWNATRAIEERFKESQKKYAAATVMDDITSDDSFSIEEM